VVLIDKLNTPLQDQVHVHQQILDFLQRMKPGTKIAIFVMGSRLRLIHGFTSDSEALRAALNDPKNGDILEKTDASRSRQDDADDQDQADMHSVMMGGSQGRNGTGYSRSRGSLAGGQASIAGNQAGERVSMTLTGLEFLARYLAGIEGRKNLIWFSSSFPVSVFPSGREQKGSLGSQSFDPGAKEASSLLALSNVAVYPVNAEGMQMDNATEASGYNQDSIGKLGQKAGERSNVAFAMNELADDTGGKAFTNTNDLAGALTHAIDDGAHYYTLAYTPANKKMDGAFRRIQVRLTEGSYDLAYRRGYYADDHAAPEPNPDSDPLHPLLVRGAPASTQIVFSARLLAAAQQPAPGDKPAGGNTKLAGPLTRYRVDFNLRPSDIELIDAAGGRHTGKIQVGLLAYDGNGAALNWAGGTVALNLSAETFASVQRTGILAHLEIDLPSAALFLEAGVYDWTARKAGTLEIPLHLAAAQQSGFQATAGQPRN
jgi:VWFA-related protein